MRFSINLNQPFTRFVRTLNLIVKWMAVYLLTCSLDVNLCYPLLHLAGVAAGLMGQCCNRSACWDAEVNLTREGL